ncbi:MAG TPA: hypothetical protein VNH11_11635 [Pirellulales bacterium]|nr:hypothetical protein [Pirellulales bacterium]
MDRILKLAVRTALLLCVAAIAAFQTYRVFHRHRSYGEGPIVALAERMRTDPVSASWLSEPPYALTCYGPAYYWAINAVAEAGGWRNSLVPGRLVSLVAALAAAALAALAAGRQTRNFDLGLLAAILFLVSLPVSEWLPYARVDMLAIAFSAAAYLAVGPGRRRLAASALAIAAGSLVKPTVALNALPIAAHLAATRRWRDAGFFVSLVAGLGAVAWGAVHWASDGFFLSGVLLGNRNPMYLWRGYLFTHQFLLSPLAVGALMVVAWRFVASPQRFAQSLFGLGFVLSLAMSAVLVCKRGSEINYFLETALLAALAIVVDGAAWLWTLDARRTRLAVGLLAVVLAVPHLREIRRRGRSPTKESPSYETAQRWLAGETSDVGLLADGRMVQVALAAGHRPWLNDSFLYMLLVDNGTLDAAPLVERLRDGRIKWLFLRKTLEEHREAIDSNTDCWPLEVIESFPRYYEFVEESDGLYIYRHRRFGDSVAGAAADDATADVGKVNQRFGELKLARSKSIAVELPWAPVPIKEKSSGSIQERRNPTGWPGDSR